MDRRSFQDLFAMNISMINSDLSPSLFGVISAVYSENAPAIAGTMDSPILIFATERRQNGQQLLDLFITHRGIHP